MLTHTHVEYVCKSELFLRYHLTASHCKLGICVAFCLHELIPCVASTCFFEQSLIHTSNIYVAFCLHELMQSDTLNLFSD